MKRIFTTIVILSSVLNSFGQTKEKPEYSNKPRFTGVSVSIIGSNFYRTEKDKIPLPSLKPHLGFSAGFIIDIINQKRFGSQLELKYIEKGSTETFNNINEDEFVTVNSKLNYGQIEIIPLILKPIGFKKLNPYLSLGGYYSLLMKNQFNYQFSEAYDKSTGITSDLVLENINKNDLGYFLNAGLQLKNVSFEYRWEIGTKSILNDSFLKNNLNSVTLKITR